ncbi:hypothetical protein DUK53_16720 [Listeria sp. SHR_NRA_18]|uniref:hypothetical protein n=1 Tax=Listeria sp. SHR_NRA_18 TaxID=2269046 RepID=UPI000F5F6E1A|nr:hypothetical protein [Listeria sp. SHR_NRA_18]RQW65364.1 hypothetical protein DUK53_16720 [Listeria sp. SHR_NRA_18]
MMTIAIVIAISIGLTMLVVSEHQRMKLKKNIQAYLQECIYQDEGQIQKIQFKLDKKEKYEKTFIVTALAILANSEDEQGVIETSVVTAGELAAYFQEVKYERRIQKMEHKNIKRMR